MSVPVMSVSLLSTAVMLAASASVAVVAAGRDAARMEVAAASGVMSTAGVIPANSATPVTLRVPDRANATPWIAASGDFVAVAWGASAAAKMADVYVAVSRDGGQTFAAPVQVNTVAGEGRLGGELPPRVSLARRTGGADPEIVVLWNARGAVASIKMSKSRDGGKTFDAPIALSSSDAAGDRGWPALTVDGRGTPHAIWVDHRGLAATRREGGTHNHGGSNTAASTKATGAGAQAGAAGRATHGSADRAAHDGVAMAQQSGLYYASLPAAPVAAASIAADLERKLTPGTCYCCKTALVTGRDDALYAAWRHVYPGNLRDIAFSVSRDRGRTFSEPVRVSEDGWEIHGCPDDGPAMTVDTRGVVHVIWPTVIGGGTADPQGALFYASTSDGRTFTPRVRIPTLGSPKPGHPQIVADDRGRLIVAWDEVIDGQRIAVVRELHHAAAGGAITFGDPLRLTTPPVSAAGAASTSPAEASTYPVLASTSRGLLAVWTSGAPGASVIAVKPIDLPPPTATASR
jgi:hypothetical protein